MQIILLALSQQDAKGSDKCCFPVTPPKQLTHTHTAKISDHVPAAALIDYPNTCLKSAQCFTFLLFMIGKKTKTNVHITSC